MNIYAARKLQKQLYKRPNTSHKSMFCNTIDGDLYYHNISHISNQDYRIMTDDFLNALSQTAVIEDVTTIMFYRGEDNIQGWPQGMYLAEIIKID